jgi:hypothetical protein
MAAVVGAKTPQEFLAEASQARQDASRFRRAALIIGDKTVAQSLKVRAGELETLAAMLEAKAAKAAAR